MKINQNFLGRCKPKNLPWGEYGYFLELHNPGKSWNFTLAFSRTGKSWKMTTSPGKSRRFVFSQALFL